MSANDNKAVEAAKGADDGPRMEDMVDDMSGGERFAELPRFGPPRAVKQVSALDAIAPAAAASPRAEVIAAADVLSSATGSAETAIPAVAAGSAAPVEEVAAADVAVVQAEPAGASSEGGTQAAVAAAVAAQEAQYVAQVVNAEPKFVLDAVDDPIAELAAMTVGPEAAPGGASSIGGLNALRAAVSDVMAQ
ncbi:MAG TPA: hypothetical protein VKJ77_26250, partial [Caballeronia sp.]|nr:hypothetical protein [Caballeronia sp.]